jgi:methionine synthase I (cobalamin-dependent)
VTIYRGASPRRPDQTRNPTVALPAVISLTVETDGRLPSGQGLGEVISHIDALGSRAGGPDRRAGVTFSVGSGVAC